MSEQAARRVPMLRGEQVYLRAAERDDLPRFVEWLNDAETAHHLTVHAPLSLPLEERWFERLLENQGGSDYHFVICLRESNEAIGTIGLHGVDHANGSAALGIAIGARDRWGRGLGTDATRAIIDFGFGELRLERIELDVFDYNQRARRAYEKAGFVFEATRRRAHFHRGQHHDVHVMSILRDEWLASPRPRGWDLD